MSGSNTGGLSLTRLRRRALTVLRAPFSAKFQFLLPKRLLIQKALPQAILGPLAPCRVMIIGG
jgi:hypothetical protein